MNDRKIIGRHTGICSVGQGVNGWIRSEVRAQRARRTLLSVGCVLSLLLVSPVHARDVLFWNKLGSEVEIQNSEIGNGGVITPSVGFAPVQHGDGAALLSGTPQVQFDAPFGSGFPDTGTIEFWWTAGRDENSSTGSHFDERLAISITSDERIPHNNFPAFSIQLMQHSGNFSNRTRMVFFSPDPPDGNRVIVEYDLDFVAGQTVHVAVTWDKSLGASPVKAYFDGQEGIVVADFSINPELVIDGIQGKLQDQTYAYDLELHKRSKRPDGAQNQFDANALVDNLKVFSVAKTDFSDRFVESFDQDSDGVADETDNCPAIFNPGQEQTGNNVGGAFGDACVDPNSNVSDGATIEPGVTIGSETVIATGVTVMAGTEIGDQVTLKRDASVGENSSIFDGTVVKKDASIGSAAMIGAGVTIGRNAALGDMVTTGEGTRIGRDALIEGAVAIGSQVVLGAGAGLRSGAEIGNQVIMRRATSVGSDSSIGDGTQIKSGARVASHTVVGENVTIGKNVQIGNRVVIGHRTFIGRDALIEDDATIGNDVRLGRRVIVRVGAVVADGTVVPADTVIVP